MRMTYLIGTALAAASVAAGPVGAAILRPITELNGPVVLLSDLFDDAGAQASRPLGPGPDPGGSIVVEAPQLAAIAREFGVAWRPSSPGDRAVLERPGVPLSREALFAALRSALAGAGADGSDGVLELPGFTPPMVGLQTHPHLAVEQIDYDAGSARFTASVAVINSGTAVPLQLRLSGRLEPTEQVLVASHPLDAGVPLVPGDLHAARVRSDDVHGPVLRTAAQALGKAPRRALPEDQPLLLADFRKAVVVSRGTTVTITLDTPGVSLASTGEALENGAEGDRISVLNPTSHAVLLAQVTGPGTVRLEAGSLPIRQGSDTAPRGPLPPRLLP
jgi:flagella basal body P-ring formation protein FlgA